MNYAAVNDHIVKWLKDYSDQSKTNGFVIGISGGIDSALTSALCAQTGKPLLCLEMPIHQHESQVTRARRHIDWLKQSHPNVESLEVELTPVFESFKSSIPDSELASRDMALVNTRARLRMTNLYYFAQLRGALVAGTGNKVEDFGVGFYTKYGDGGVDLSPIADLLKSEVRACAKELGVIEEIIQAAPTDGLWGDNRTDEDQIGATYPELEWAMDHIAKAKSEEGLTERQQEVLAIYRRYHSSNKHKMIPIPVCEIPDSLR